MILHLDGSIGEEMLNLLIDSYNKLEFTGTGELERLKIMFSSEGGENQSTSAMIHIINQYKDITEIVAYQELSSNGFRLFYEVECSKVLLKGTLGMYHLTFNSGGATLYEGMKDKPFGYTEFLKKRMKNMDYLENMHSLVNFTEKELETIKGHNDLWMDYPRLNQMLKYNLSR